MISYQVKLRQKLNAKQLNWELNKCIYKKSSKKNHIQSTSSLHGNYE